jgi:hypothetical protein
VQSVLGTEDVSWGKRLKNLWPLSLFLAVICVLTLGKFLNPTAGKGQAGNLLGKQCGTWEHQPGPQHNGSHFSHLDGPNECRFHA